MFLRPIKYIIGRKADAQKNFKIAQGTRFGYAKRTLEINYIEISGRQHPTPCELSLYLIQWLLFNRYRPLLLITDDIQKGKS